MVYLLQEVQALMKYDLARLTRGGTQSDCISRISISVSRVVQCSLHLLSSPILCNQCKSIISMEIRSRRATVFQRKYAIQFSPVQTGAEGRHAQIATSLPLLVYNLISSKELEQISVCPCQWIAAGIDAKQNYRRRYGREIASRYFLLTTISP